MPHITADRVRETTTTTGTGNVTVLGAESGYLAFSARLANNDTCFYCISHRTAAEFEVGLGTYVSATPAIARTNVIASSNGDAAVNFSAGTKDVFLTSPAIAQDSGVLATAPSANQNDYTPAGMAFANRLLVGATATLKLTGLGQGYNGRRLTLHNSSTDFLVWLEHESTASSAANRFTLPRAFPFFLMPGDAVALWYNGATSRWEMEASAWSTMGLDYFSDFADGVASGVAGGFAGGGSGAGASAQASTYLVDTTEKPMGVIQLDTGTTSTGRVTIGSNAGTGEIVPTLGCALHVARLAIETAVDGTETFQVFTGFIDCSGGTPTDGVCWTYRWNGSAAEWSQERFAATAATRTTTGSPTPGTTYIWLVIFVNPAWTRADFIYSDDSKAFTVASSPTTGFPSSTQTTTWAACSMIKSAGTTQRNCSLDLAGYRVETGARG